MFWRIVILLSTVSLPSSLDFGSKKILTWIRPLFSVWSAPHNLGIQPDCSHLLCTFISQANDEKKELYKKYYWKQSFKRLFFWDKIFYDEQSDEYLSPTIILSNEYLKFWIWILPKLGLEIIYIYICFLLQSYVDVSKCLYWNEQVFI